MILAFTDFHGKQEAYQRAEQRIESEKPDLILVAGDIINHDSNRAKGLLLRLAEAGRPVYFVPGNMDGEDLAEWPGEGDVYPLHGRYETTGSISLIGLGGSPHGPFRTVFEYSEAEAARLLQEAAKDYRGGQLILLSHCPPRDTKVDRISGGEHIGSVSVRKFVEEVQPALVVSGHVHEAQGIDTIGPSTLVNTGPAQRGQYAVITFGNKVSVSFGKFF